MLTDNVFIDIFDLKDSLKKIWYYYLIIGLLLAITGAMGIFTPVVFSISLIYILSYGFLLMGFLNVYYAFKGRHNKYFHWGLILFNGIIDILAAICIFLNPFQSVIVLLIYIGILIMFKGFSLIFTKSKSFANEIPETHGLRALAVTRGILDVIFGVMIILCPLVLDFILPMIIGFYLLFAGLLMIIYSFQIKKAD